MDEDKTRHQLEDCLIKDYFDFPEAYSKLKDPFPAWFQQPAAAS